MPTDKELVEEILKGSQAAMEVLVKRHYKTVFSFVYRKIGDYHNATDLTQEVFIKVLKALTVYQDVNKFEHWILKIAINCCRDYFRSKEFSQQNNIVEYDDAYIETNVCNMLEKSLYQYEVKAAIMLLPEEQKETVILYFYNGYKIKEISKLTNTKEATVKSRLHQAQNKLRKTLVGGEYYAEHK